ncbi:MAG: kelch repeat-containing protein, partial [Pseudomonadota bacterium]
TGKVLITGGWDCDAVTRDTAEYYRPETQTFSYTVGNMTTGRKSHRATRLLDGRVLITGGRDESDALSSAEIYDPETGLFTATSGSMNSPRFNHTATLLNDGKVLIAGGYYTVGYAVTNSVELFDPDTGTFSSISPMSVAVAGHQTTLLASDKVLLAGGTTGVGDKLRTAYLFDGSTFVGDTSQCTATGGLPPYTYSINSGQGSVDEDGLYSTTDVEYGQTVSIKVTDAMDNIETANIVITAE